MCVSKCPDRFATYTDMQLHYRFNKSHWDYYKQFCKPGFNNPKKVNHKGRLKSCYKLNKCTMTIRFKELKKRTRSSVYLYIIYHFCVFSEDTEAMWQIKRGTKLSGNFIVDQIEQIKTFEKRSQLPDCTYICEDTRVCKSWMFSYELENCSLNSSKTDLSDLYYPCNFICILYINRCLICVFFHFSWILREVSEKYFLYIFIHYYYF